MVPTLPLANPPNARERSAQRRVFEKPNSTLEIMVQNKDIRMVSFRPNRSDAWPHQMPVRDCDREKMADVVPAHCAILSVGTLNDSISSGRYGNTEVRATGSANRHIAASQLSDQMSLEFCHFSPITYRESRVAAWAASAYFESLSGLAIANMKWVEENIH